MDCSKLNEIFNIDGPDWIEDDIGIRLVGMSDEQRAERKREIAAAYYVENKEKVLEKRRERYADGGYERKKEYQERDGVREMLRKSVREYDLKNKDRLKEYRRKRYVENREKLLEEKRDYYQKHKEKMRQKGREKYWNKKQTQKKAI